MLALALATLRGRWPAVSGAFVALALGAALAISAGEVIAAAKASVATGPQRYRAAPVVVAPAPVLRYAVGAGVDREIDSDPNPHPRALDPTLPARIAALPGVTRVVVDRSVALRAPSGNGASGVGRPWSARLVTPYRLERGRAPVAPNEIVVAAGALPVAVGGTTVLVTPDGPVRFRVVGIVAPRAGRGQDGETPVFFTDAAAARLSPRVDAVALWPRGAAAAVQSELAREGSDAVVLTGDARSQAEQNAERTALAGAGILLSLMGMTIGFVAAFAIASSFAFSVALRRRELALLRTVGATPRQVRRLVLREALILAAVAAVTGSVMSLVTAPLLGRWIAGRGLAPRSLHVPPSLLAMALGGGFMVLVGLVGAWAAARRAARVRPVEDLRDAAVDRGVMTLGRWLVGGLALASALLAAMATPSTDASGQLLVTLTQTSCLVVALAMLAPLIIPRLVSLVVWPATSLSRAEPLLVRRHAQAAVRRTAATAAPVLVIVALAGALATMVNALTASNDASIAGRVDPRASLVTANTGLSASDVAAIRAIPGTVVGTTLDADLRAMGGDGMTAYPTTAANTQGVGLVMPARLLSGSLHEFSGDAVALGELTARALHKHVGDRIPVWLPDGTARLQPLRVVAVLADGFGQTAMYVPRDVLAGHVGSTAATSAYVRPTGNERLTLARLRGVVRQRGLALQVATASRPAADPTDSSHMNRLALWVILGVAALYVGISLAATSAIATVARASELAIMRLAGATPRQILRLVAVEALVTTSVGAVMGLTAAGVVILALRRGLNQIHGPAVVPVPWTLLAMLISACAVIATVAAVLAAERSQRPAPHLLLPGGT